MIARPAMMDLLSDIYMLEMAPVSPGADACVERLVQAAPAEARCTVHEYPSGADYNGWIVPDSWWVESATIHRDGELIYDGKAHPLGVISMSEGFEGELTLEELSDHIVTTPALPDAIVYHWENFYRPGRLRWGFSMPDRLFRSLENDTYTVRLITRRRPGAMKVAEFFLPGDTDQEIVLNAHNCHAGQANDDGSGIVAGMEVLRRLAELPNRRYGYRLLIAPELFGTAFWLNGRTAAERTRIRGCILLKAVGNDDVLRVQHSFTGEASLDKAAAHWLRWREPSAERGAYREVYGNDETVFEAPGFEIPTITFTRVAPIPGPHYPEYHTSADDLSVVSEERLRRCVEGVMGVLGIEERNCTLMRRFEGLVCLGNPRYGLYIQAQDPSVKPEITIDERKWYMLMTCLPRYLDGAHCVLEIADKHGLPFEMVETYIRKYEEKGLLARRL